MFTSIERLPVSLNWSVLHVVQLLTMLFIYAIAFEASGAELIGLTGNVQFEIPPQPLGPALLRYSEQAGVQIAFSDVIAKDLRSPGVTGTYSRARALMILLDGSGLSFRVTADRTVAIGPTASIRAPVDTSEAPTTSVDQPTVLAARTEPSIIERPEANEMSALESITVMSQRTTDAVARAAEFEAANLINVTTAEEISRLPDVNAAEAIRRVPGISLEGDTGEGRFINIRGLDADLNSTTFGGLRLPPTNNASPFAGGRAVAYDSIPIGFIGALTVTKTNLPEQDAEALGGTIEITPKTAPAGGKPFANLKLGTGIEPLRHTGIKDFSATVGTRFGGSKDWQPFSIILTGAFYEDRRGIDDIEAAYQDAQPAVPDKAFNALEQRWYQYDRKRHGYGADLGYQPNEDNKYYFRFYDAGYSQIANRQRLLLSFGVNYVGGKNVAIDPANPNTFIDNVTFDKTLRDLKEVIDSKVFALGGTNEFNDKTLDYHVGYTRGTYDKPYDENPDFQNPTTGVIHYDNTTKPNWPSYAVSGVVPTDPSGYGLVGFNNSSIYSDDHEWGIGVNLKIPTHLSGAPDENLKIGLNARLRRRTAEGVIDSYSSVPTLALSQAISGGNIGFYNGQYQNGPNINPNTTEALYAGGTNPAFIRNTGSDAINSALQYQNGKENVLAAYGQYQWGYGALGLVGGLRVERTNASYGSNALVTPVKGSSFISPVSASTSYTNYFPSLQARYSLAPDLIVRAALSSTIARPGFNQVNASTSINPAAGVVQSGNPKLKPTRATSFDLSIDKKLPHAGVLSLGVFDKEITDYIVAIQTTQTFPNNGLFAGFVGPAHVFTYGNAPKSRVVGAEFNYIQRFRDLVPEPLSGLGLVFNYTLLSSRVQIRPGEYSLLPSSSRNTGNLTLLYETHPLNVSLGAYYVSRDLVGVGGSSATDSWSQARFSVDFGAQYKISDTFSVYLDLKNLTNTPLFVTEGASANRPVQREFYGITALAGVTIDF